MSWQLPKEAVLEGRHYPHRWDFRQIIKLLGVLDDPQRPQLLRWYTALAYFFYGAQVPEEPGMAYLQQFLQAGQEGPPGPRLYDWQQDAQLIAAGVNAVAGRELRQEEQLHWWTFLSYFRSMGQGQFSLVVGIRDKLRRGKKLEDYELEFYRENPALVKLRPRPDPQQQRLLALLEA